MDKAQSPEDAHIGSRLRLARQFRGLAQKELGEAVGLTFQQIQKYENGRNSIRPAKLMQFARILNVPISYFFDGYDEQADPMSPTLGDIANGATIEDIEFMKCYLDLPKEVKFPLRQAVIATSGAITAAKPMASIEKERASLTA